MRFFAQFVSLAILIGAAGLATPLCAPAQEGEAASSGTIREVLPVAPEPQSGALGQRSGDQPEAAPEQKGGQSETERQAAQDRRAGFIGGTVTNTNGDIVPGAIVKLECEHPADRRTATASDTGAFQFADLKAGVRYQITIEATDLETWKSETIILEAGQYLYLKDIKLKIPDLVTSVMVYASQEQLATEQVELETKQRVFGFIPNFYVTYDPQPVPLTTKLKFKLAFRADTDFMTFVGVAFMSAMYQAGDLPDYGQGWDAFAKRMAAGYGDTTSDIFLGGAIYPWLFRQDPRYFYQGTGSTRSRAIHAMSSPYICKGDNGKTQPNFSSLLGDLSSGAISNLYYPESNRGAGLVFQGFAITTGVRTVNGLVQEFILRRFTPSARNSN